LSAAVAATWRVRDRATFAALRDGRRGHAGPVRVTWLPEPGTTTPPRVALAVGRRVGPAVARNRLRRQLRSVIADLAPGLAPGAYLVAYRGAPGAAFDDLRRQVAAAATTAGALPVDASR
jgi:ribonuclease P protein component